MPLIVRLLCALWLLCSAVAQAAVPDLATLFSLDAEAVEAALQKEPGRSQPLVGVVLADVYGVTSPELAMAQLDRLKVEHGDGSAVGQDYIGYGHAVRCSALVRLSQLDHAKPFCARAEALIDSLQDSLVKTRVLSAVHFLAIRQGMMEEALELSLRIERSARDNGHPFLEATALNASALTFAFSGLHAQAIDRFERARRKLENYEDRPLNKMITFNLGLAYQEVGDSARALDAFREGYDWALATAQSNRVFIAQIEMANALNRLGRAQQSIDALRPAVDDRTAVHDPDSLMHALLSLGRAYLLLHDPERALRYLERGVELATRQGNRRRKRQLELTRIEALHALDQNAAALTTARTLVTTLRAEQPNDELGNALALLAELEAVAGNPLAAYNNHVDAQRIADQARGASLERRLTLLEVAARLERAEHAMVLTQARENALLARADRDRAIGIGGALCLAMAIVVFAFDRIRRRQRLEVAEHRGNAESLEQLVHERTHALEEQMTQRMKGEEDRRKLEQELAENDKLRSLGQLTGGVAHDFNNLLTIITGAAELLDVDPEMDEHRRRDLVHAIQQAADSGGEINAGLLAYARRQQLNPELIDLSEFFDGANGLLRRTLGEGMTLEIETAPLTIQVDKGQLTTALINLLTNAREASDTRGKVAISVRGSADDAGASALIAVRDWGCGMTPEEVQKSTEPFYSTKDEATATGLGLSRVYGFVEQSGGRLMIESEPGAGTTVTISFPIMDRADGLVSATRGTPASPRRILLVDDNDDVRDMVVQMLVHVGHSVIVANSGEQALSMLDEQQPDLLISDVLMPGEIGGRELADEVRKRVPDMPILMISGYVQAPDLGYPLLAKPFSLTDLEDALAELLSSSPAR